MKNTIKFISLFISIFVGAYAQTELPMLKSRSALLAYAVSQATETNGFLYSNDIPTNGNDYKEWSGSKSALGVLEQVKLLKLTADTVDPKSKVYVYVTINNRDGDSLFYGYTESLPVQINGVWSLPASASNIELTALSVPIQFEKSVSYAEMLYKDANGNTNYASLNVYGKKVWFSPDSAGLKDAYVRIHYTDGTTASFSVSTGQLLQTYALSATLAPTFKDLYTYKNPTAIVSLTVKSDMGKGTVPTFEVTLDGVSNVAFDIVTSEGKRPQKFWLRGATSTAWTSVSATATGATSIAVPQGVTYVVPEWNPTEFSENTQPVQTGSYGKG